MSQDKHNLLMREDHRKPVSRFPLYTDPDPSSNRRINLNNKPNPRESLH